MEHVQHRKHYINENEKLEQKVTPVTFEEEQLLFLGKTCAAFIEEDDKYLVITAIIGCLGADWNEFKKWYEFRYTGK